MKTIVVICDNGIGIFEKGTVVAMKLSDYTHRKSREVFDKYSDVDGGFNKTVIPLKQ